MPTPTGPQFSGFHGTGRSIPVGGEILPKNQVENIDLSLNHPTSDPDSTYFSTNEHRAWGHARAYRKTRGEMDAYGLGTYDDDFIDKFQQRPRVYTTKPDGPVESDPEFPDDSFKAPKQVVTGVEWTPPPRTSFGEEWVQGTLPEVNWNKYNAPNWLTGVNSGYSVVKDDRGYELHDKIPVPSYYSHFPDESPYSAGGWSRYDTSSEDTPKVNPDQFKILGMENY
jgi:hypothetical protein